MLKDRLKQARHALMKTQKEVSDAVGMSQPSYFQLESGKTLRSSYLPAIADFLKVDATWLLNGEEKNSPFKDKNEYKQLNTLVEDWDSHTPLDDDEVEIPFYKDFKMACGHGTYGENNNGEWRKLRFSKSTLRVHGINKKDACAVEALGDSMMPLIHTGATIFMDTSRKTIKDGRVYAFEHGGLSKIKYLYNLPLGGVRIVSANSEEYPEERLNAQQIIDEEFNICGQVFSISMMIPF